MFIYSITEIWKIICQLITQSTIIYYVQYEHNSGAFHNAQLQVLFDVDRICAYLKGNEDAELDQLAEKILSSYEMQEFDVYGISLGGDFSLIQIHAGLVIAKYIQKTYQKPVLAGGNNVTYLYNFNDIYAELWNAIDASEIIIMKGAGEIVLASIIPKLEQGERVKSEDIPGGIYRKESEIVANPEKQPIVVRPNWDGLPLDLYKKYINYFWTNEFFVVPNSLIGKYPDKYHITLRKNFKTYRKLAKYNEEMFLENNGASCMGYNSRLYAYDENNGRKYEQISLENADKLRRINLLQNPQIHNMANIYEDMLRKYRKF